MKEQLLAMVEELIDAIEEKSSLPEVIENARGDCVASLQTRRDYISRGYNRNASEFEMAGALSGIVLHLSADKAGILMSPTGEGYYRLSGPVDSCLEKRARELVTTYYEGKTHVPVSLGANALPS